VGTAGIASGGKNHRIPLAALGDLDERMKNPLRPALVRPQQLSYPHLNGLYLLFRRTGLGVSSGEGSSGRLSVDPGRLAEWSALNAEERYFTLFQTMLAADWSPIEAGSSTGPLQEIGWQFDWWLRSQPAPTAAGVPASEFFYSWRAQTTAALLELFGMLELPRGKPRQGESWRLTAVRLTKFGRAFLTRVRKSPDILGILRERQGDDDKWLADLFPEYPNCVNTLPGDAHDFRDGVWQFKVSWGKVWRRLVIPAESSVDELVAGILNAFRFDIDHLYAFTVRDRSGRNVQIAHPAVDDAEYITDEYAIGSLPLDPGQSMKLVYDFGDWWEFTVKLEKILPEDGKLRKAKLIAKDGKAPRQYDNDGW